jgi:hypothetical protein
MSQRTEADEKVEVTDVEIEDASREVARAVWNVVLLARDDHKARGLLGRVHRRTLVEKIAALVKLVRRTRS